MGFVNPLANACGVLFLHDFDVIAEVLKLLGQSSVDQLLVQRHLMFPFGELELNETDVEPEFRHTTDAGLDASQLTANQGVDSLGLPRQFKLVLARRWRLGVL